MARRLCTFLRELPLDVFVEVTFGNLGVSDLVALDEAVGAGFLRGCLASSTCRFEYIASRVLTWTEVRWFVQFEEVITLRSVVVEPFDDDGSSSVWHYWFKGGTYHRANGLPAIECVGLTRSFYERGQLHRDGGLPAEECFRSGQKRWSVRGQTHRADNIREDHGGGAGAVDAVDDDEDEDYAEDDAGPAVIRADGTREWWQHDRPFRSGGRPHRVRADGTQEWLSEAGEVHRDENDEPAVIHADGTRDWRQHGKYFRAGDRPTRVLHNGTQEWRREDGDGGLYREGNLPAVIEHSGNGYEWYRDGHLVAYLTCLPTASAELREFFASSLHHLPQQQQQQQQQQPRWA